MRIQHNIMAMSAYRNYTNNVSAMKKNLEKLSSGYKINRAGDDAAGLAISEKMRAQITGLETAQKNAKDGISLVQTAEGALTEVHDMLNRMVELASMSANGTYDDTTDRAQLQKEMDQLRSEINRIADSANFNGINLLDGSMQKGATVGVESKTLSESELMNLLPAEVAAGSNNEIGVIANGTVVETDDVSAGSASFVISLDGLADIDATTGGTFELNIGGTAITVNLTAGANTAGQIAAAFATKFNGSTSVSSVTLFGSEFKITASGDELTFEATDTGRVNLDAGAKVEWSWVPTGGATSYALEDGIAALDENSGVVAYASGDAKIDPVASGVAVSVGSISATVNTKDGIGWSGSTDVAGALASAAGVTSGAITLKYDATSGWVLKTGTGTALTAAVASATIPGTATSGNALEIDFGNGVKVTLTATGVSSSETLNVGNYQTAFGTAQTIGTLGVESATPTPSSGTPSSGTPSTTTGSVTISLTVSGATNDYSSATSATPIQSGDMAAFNTFFQSGGGSSITVDGKQIKLDTVSVTASDTFKELGQKIANAIKAELANDTSYVYSDIKVQFGNDTPIAAQAVGSIPPITVTYTRTARQNPTPPGGNTGAMHGVINSGLQETKSGADEAVGMRANTRLDTSQVSGIWNDGSKITIGSKTVTIKNGKNSSVTGTDVIDVTDLTTNQRVQALANKLGDGNTIFSVGHDGNNLTLQQLDPNDTEMRSREQIVKNGKISITTQTLREGMTEAGTGKALTLQIGDTSDSWNQIKVDIRDTHCRSLGKLDANGNLVGKSLADISIADQEDAQDAVDVIKDAINYVSDVRGTLGATQNRLDHTINNLSVMTENIQDAESTIRDVDVAEEMMAYTKNNILIQSAQAMLAQANQVPQGVLQLLQ